MSKKIVLPPATVEGVHLNGVQRRDLLGLISGADFLDCTPDEPTEQFLQRDFAQTDPLYRVKRFLCGALKFAKEALPVLRSLITDVKLKDDFLTQSVREVMSALSLAWAKLRLQLL